MSFETRLMAPGRFAVDLVEDTPEHIAALIDGVDLILDAIEGRLADGPLHLYEPFTLAPRASTIG